MVEPGDLAYWDTGDGQMTVFINDIENGVAFVVENGGDEEHVFEVDVSKLQGPL